MPKTLLLFLLLSISSIAYANTNSLDSVKLQLRWHHQYQFAGYYAAVHKGFFKEAGLDVEIIQGGPDRQPVSQVSSGHAEYGVANSELIHHFLLGDRYVALAAIAQQSPSVIIMRKDSGIREPKDLIGKRVMMLGGTEDIDFLRMLDSERVDVSKIKIQPSSYNIQDLIDKKTDAFNAYLTNEPFFMKEKGVEAFVIRPADYGISFYSDILFTTEAELETNPERVKRFREASLKGWQYALDNPDEIIDLILRKYSTSKSRAHMRYEARVLRSLIAPNIMELGNIDLDRTKSMVKSISGTQKCPDDINIEDLIYTYRLQNELSFKQYVVFAVIALLTITTFITLIRLRAAKRENTKS